MYEQGKFDAIAELKIDGKVVLTKEEYNALLLEQKRLKEIVDRIPCGYEQKDKARKETVKEFAEGIIKMLWNRGRDADGKMFEYGDLTSIDVWELAKQFGAEVE